MRSTLTIFIALIAHMCYDHVDDVSLHTPHIHTYIQMYSNFLVGVIYVGLASARRNYEHQSDKQGIGHPNLGKVSLKPSGTAKTR